MDGADSLISQRTALNLGTSSGFKIPKKANTAPLLRNVAMDSGEYESEVLPILKHHQSRAVQNRNGTFRYTKCTEVNNEVLLKKFDEKRHEMRQAKTDTTITYGFWQTFTDDELDSLCKNGLSSNYILGTLGQWDKGVYVSQHANLLTGAPLMDTGKGTMVIFKVLKGHVKLVPGKTSAHLEPSPNYDCHAPKQDASSPSKIDENPLRLFESNLLYIYDYVDVDLQVPPRNVCPIAIIDYDYREQSALPYWLKNELQVWTGSLRFENGQRGDYEMGVSLATHLAKMKPPYLSESLLIKKLVPTQLAIQWEPIQEICSDGNQGSLYKQRRDLRLNSGRYVSVFRLIRNNPSEKFKKLMDAMYDSSTVGLANLHDGTAILVFPQSHFSCHLGIPVLRETTKCLYCLVFADRSMVTGTGFTRDPYETNSRVDASPLQTNVVQPKKFNELTITLVEKHVSANSSKDTDKHQVPPAPSITKKIVVPSSICFKSSAQSNVTTATAPPVLSATGTAAAIRDPRILKRMRLENLPSLATSSVNKAVVTPVEAEPSPLVRNVESVHEPSWVQPPVDLEESCHSVEDMDIDDQEEMDETYPPKIMPLENIEHSQPLMEYVTTPTVGVATEASQILHNDSHSGHQDVSHGQSCSSMSAMDNAVLNVIYGIQSTKRRRESNNEDEEAPYDPGQSPMSDLPLSDGESTDSSEDVPATAPKTSSLSLSDEWEPEPTNAIMDGIVVPDDLVLTHADPEQILKIMTEFRQWRKNKSSDWRLKLHLQAVLKLSSMRDKLPPTSIQQQRAASILTLFHQFGQEGVVELLEEHECDHESCSAAVYLPCLRRLKAEAGGHCIFLTDTPPELKPWPEGTVARGLLESDILVMSVKTLVEDFGFLDDE